MAKQKQAVEFGALPRVDLLPDAQREDQRFERGLPTFGLLIVASAAVAGLIWAAGMLPVNLASQRLAEAEAESTGLLAQIGQHAELQKTLSRQSALAAQLRTLTGTEVLFAERLDEISELLPDGIVIDEYSAALPPADPKQPTEDEKVGQDLNPLCVAEAATLTVVFHGPGLVLDKDAEFIRAMNEETVRGFQCVVATKIERAEDGDPQVVTAQVALNKDALAKRFEEAGQ